MNAEAPGDSLVRSTVAVTAGNITSRLTGFVRVLAVGAGLGTTFVGNTYQTSNLVSNVAFELLAAGLLSSVLVPIFVGLLDTGKRADAEHVAGAVLGLCLAVLGTVTVVGLLARPWVMRALTVAVSDPEVRRQEVRLGSFFLVFFLPQLLCYAVGSVATALLQSCRRFAAPAFAPVANNVIVTATMVVFVAQRRGGGAPGLDLPGSQQLVLAIGTTAGVVAMTLVPLAAASRAGLRVRPRWDPGNPDVRRLARPGAWAAGYLALAQVLVAVTLVLANRVPGGVVAFQIAFTFFLLPFAVLANPVLTTLFPRMASEAHAGRPSRLAGVTTAGVRSISFLVLPASALLVALAGPVMGAVRLGSLDAAGADLVARVVAAYAIGIVGYSLMQHLTRASYASGDTRTPTLVSLGTAVGGAALMLVLSGRSDGRDRVVMLGLAHSAAMLVGAAALAVLVRRRFGQPLPFAGSLARSAGCAVAAGLAARLVADTATFHGRLGSAATVVLGGLVGAGVYAGCAYVLRAPELRALRLRSPAEPAP